MIELKHTVDEAIAKFSFISGIGDGKNTACAVSALSWVVGEPWSDQPRCAHPVLARYVVKANDSVKSTQEMRHDLVRIGSTRLIGTASIPTSAVVASIGQTAGLSSYNRAVEMMRLLAEELDSLTHADLRYANLTGADLTGANLQDADLTGASLRAADLRAANLTGADLTGADLTGANLQATNLGGADLLYVNLTGASLLYTNLGGADLQDADLGDWERGPDGFAVRK